MEAWISPESAGHLASRISVSVKVVSARAVDLEVFESNIVLYTENGVMRLSSAKNLGEFVMPRVFEKEFRLRSLSKELDRE